MFKGKKIAIIGGGKMGSIIAQALFEQKIFPQTRHYRYRY